MTSIATTGVEINRKVSVLEVTVPAMKRDQDSSRDQLSADLVQYQRELKDQIAQLVSRPEFEARMAAMQIKQSEIEMDIYKLKNPPKQP